MKEKVICLVSGGIDSPVACAMVAERFNIVPLHFCQYPYTSRENALLGIEALENMRDVVGFEDNFILPWPRVLKRIETRVEEGYSCVTCRRAMLRAAEYLCDEIGAGAIVTGESLGQKASQTLSNIRATSTGIGYPVLRPLLGMDKNEVVERSKEIGLWRAQHSGCCSVVPDRPRTRADPDGVEDRMNKINLDDLYRDSRERVLRLEDFEEDRGVVLDELAEGLD